MNNKNKAQLYLPIIVASAIVVGIFLGNILANRSGNKNLNITNLSPTNKISTLLEVINRNYVDTINVQKVTEDIIPDILRELDPHSVYIPAKDVEIVNDELDGSFGGIGIHFNMQNDTVIVVDVIGGGPSELVGLLPGDRIIAVEDSTIAGVKLADTKVVSMLRGKKGTKVNITVKRPNVGNIEFEITRGDIPTYTVDVAYMITPETGYVKVSKFGAKTYDEFINALAKFKHNNAKSMIVDLRGNQGGYLEIAAKMLNEFLSKGDLIVFTKGKAVPYAESRANGSGSAKSIRLIVLVDEWSASASEIFAGAIQDNDRGLIIGRRTFGKGLVQNQFPFSDGSALRLTIARYYIPSGRCIQKPYDEGLDQYNQDIYNRYIHGEMYEKDSIQQNNNEEYRTKNGRIVYGGGGVLSDIFVPTDTTDVTISLNRLIQKGLIYKFAFDYSDKNRKRLSSLKE